MIWFIRTRKDLAPGERIFLTCVLSVLLGMIFLNGFKAPNYWIYLIPFYNAVLAAWLLDLLRRGNDAGLIGFLLTAAFTLSHLTVSIQHIRADEYHKDYLPAIAALKKYQAEGKSIVGQSALGFGLGFQGFADDWRMGAYSGLKPDILVLDRSYRDFPGRFEKQEPVANAFILKTLATNYRLRERYGTFWILERVPEGTPPGIDLKAVNVKEPGQRAEYLFELLSKTGNQNSKGNPNL
jgi:hypothetical protein